MKMNFSSKTVSVGISFLFFLAIGILAVSFIGKGNSENTISFEEYSEIDYSEHEDWTDVSQPSHLSEESLDESMDIDMSESERSMTAEEIVSYVNSEYYCSGETTDLQFSDEMGIFISKIDFLDNYTPENVSYLMGYVFAGDKVYDVDGKDITEIVEGYAFTNLRNSEGKALFKKNEKYFYLENGIFIESLNTNNINAIPAYAAKLDENPVLFNSNGKWGAKNEEEKVIVKANYTYGYGFHNGIGCFASKDKKLYFFNSSGKSLSSGEYMVPENVIGALRFENGITLVSDGFKNVILNQNGSIVDTPFDYNILGCSDGMILLEKNDKKGFMNEKGIWILNPEFLYADYYSEGLSIVSINGQFVIDRAGNVIIPKGFDYISSFSEGHALMYSLTSGWYIAEKNFIN